MRVNYYAHLQSDYWRKDVHDAVKERCRRSNGCVCCERCLDTTSRLAKHHLTYSTLGRELQALHTVILVCDGCHAWLHGRSSDDPADQSDGAIMRRIENM